MSAPTLNRTATVAVRTAGRILGAGLLVGVAIAVLVLALDKALDYLPEHSDTAPVSRIRYPNEEAHARQLCATQRQKLLYWWTSDPRKKRAEMHAHCTGVVTVVRDVDFGRPLDNRGTLAQNSPKQR